MKNTHKMKTMKTIYVLAAFLGMPFSTIYAAGFLSEAPASLNSKTSYTTSVTISPVTPSVATFEEITLSDATMPESTGLIPGTPSEADFNDEAPSAAVSTAMLAPVTPKEADFEEVNDINGCISAIELAPVTPACAEFEEQR